MSLTDWVKMSFGDVINEKQHTKAAVPPFFHGVLTKWKTEKDDTILAHCTFRYLVQYWNKGEIHERLSICLADIGYTQEEIDTLKKEGKSLGHIVDEILARGIDDSD